MSDAIAQITALRIAGSPAVVSCRRMPRGYANANYRLETSAGVFLLRHVLRQDRSAVEYELNVLGYLRTNGFPAPAALRFAAGDQWITGPGDSRVVRVALGPEVSPPRNTYSSSSLMASVPSSRLKIGPTSITTDDLSAEALAHCGLPFTL